MITAGCTIVQSAVLRFADWMSSVCTLVDQDHIGWISWKLIARTISPALSLFLAQTLSIYSQGNMGNFGETKGGVGKSGVLEHKSGVRIDEKLLWRAYKNLPTLFRTVLEQGCLTSSRAPYAKGNVETLITRRHVVHFPNQFSRTQTTQGPKYDDGDDDI